MFYLSLRKFKLITNDFLFFILGKKLLNSKKIIGLKVVNVKYDNSSNLINARISWRQAGMTEKKFLYTLSWVAKDCEDESKLLIKTQVS